MGRSHGALNQRVPFADHGSADVVSARLFKYLDTLAKVVGRITIVRAGDRHVATSGSGDARVHPAGRDPCRIVYQPDAIVFPCDALENAPRAVVGHPVSDDDLEATRRHLLIEEGLDTFLDVPALVAARDDHRQT